MNLASLIAFAVKLRPVIIGAMQVVAQFKSAAGAEKKAAVIAAIPESVHLLDFPEAQAVLQDPGIQSLVGAVIDAEAAAAKAHDALKAGILAKAA